MTARRFERDAVHRRLKWAVVLSPVVVVVGLEYSRLALTGDAPGWGPRLLAAAPIIGLAMAFYALLFAILESLRQEARRHTEELVALRDAGLEIAGDLSLDTVLAKVVDHARRLIGTRYGALSVIDEQGVIQNFVTSGIDATTRAKLGDPPRGHGLLGVVLREGQRLRLDDLTHDPRAGGFPPHHPAMKSLLAVPIVCRGPFKGNLYLSERLDGRPFEAADEEALGRFATQAAIAIDNAYLHRRVRALDVAQERVRIAHELHDGQAQVLASVNVKAQAVLEFLRSDRIEPAIEQLEQLAAAAREVYADVREEILGLREAAREIRLEASLREYLERWRERHGIAAELVVIGSPNPPQEVELQVLRVVQEAMANARKHAAATNVRVTLAAESNQLRICVEDDGIGFHPEAFERHRIPRFGLATMSERAQAIGARFAVESEPGHGTRITVTYSGDGVDPTPAHGAERRAEQ